MDEIGWEGTGKRFVFVSTLPMSWSQTLTLSRRCSQFLHCMVDEFSSQVSSQWLLPWLSDNELGKRDVWDLNLGY